MDIKEYKELMMDYVTGKLNEEKRVEFEHFINTNPESLKEIDHLRSIWKTTDELDSPEPSIKMDEKFYSFLDSERATKRNPSIIKYVKSLLIFPDLNAISGKLTYGVIVLFIGMFLGNKIDSNIFNGIQNSENHNSEVEEVRSQLVLALLEQPSANKRLQAVDEANKLVEVEEIVINALFKTLNNDPNTNVRLATVESLSNYVNLPTVREGLVKSIIKQKSPLVQIALADLMVAIDEKKSIDSFKQLLNKKEVNETAKQKISQSIQYLL